MKRPFKSTRDVTGKQRDRDKKRATAALGKPLNGHPVHHHSRKQLVICENVAYHWLLHARQAILEAVAKAKEVHARYLRLKRSA